MPVIIHKTNNENFPSKVAVCGTGLFDNHLLSAVWARRTEWVYSRLRTGIVIHTAISAGEVVGQITALPLPDSPIELEGEGLWYIPCIWMVPKYATPMLADQLLVSIVQDLESIAEGVITLTANTWMNHMSVLESCGFERVGEFARLGGTPNTIMGLRMTEDFKPPVRIPANPPPPDDDQFHFFYSAHCPAHVVLNYRISKEHCLSNCQSRLVKYDCSNRDKIRRYGISFGLYYRGREVIKKHTYGMSLCELVELYGGE